MQIEMMHGNDWRGQDVSGWWVSEKLNGWRIRWDGRSMFTRNGNKLDCPFWFTAQLPEGMTLDCELHLGRGKTDCDVHSAISKGDWTKLRITPFDVPGMVAEDAIEELKMLAVAISFSKAKSSADANGLMKEIVSLGGEGIMLRKPGSDYVPYRTNDLLKMKP